jgi:hypothetical protein
MRIIKLRITKVCKNCGKTFETRKKNQFYCCHECYLKHHNQCIKNCTEKNREPLEKKLCKFCGKEFMPIRPYNQKFCTEKCRLEWYERQSALKPKHKNICHWCKLEFLSRMTARFCSDICRMQFYHARNALYKRYSFETEKSNEEYSKLEKLGRNFVLEDDE